MPKFFMRTTLRFFRLVSSHTHQLGLPLSECFTLTSGDSPPLSVCSESGDHLEGHELEKELLSVVSILSLVGFP